MRIRYHVNGVVLIPSPYQDNLMQIRCGNPAQFTSLSSIELLISCCKIKLKWECHFHYLILYFQVKKERPVVHLPGHSESLGMPQYGKLQKATQFFNQPSCSMNIQYVETTLFVLTLTLCWRVNDRGHGKVDDTVPVNMDFLRIRFM